MSCQDCCSPDCQVEAADRQEATAWTEMSADVATQDDWIKAMAASAAAEEACRRRSQGPGLLARIGALEARQDRIEAMLIAKGYTL